MSAESCGASTGRVYEEPGHFHSSSASTNSRLGGADSYPQTNDGGFVDMLLQGKEPYDCGVVVSVQLSRSHVRLDASGEEITSHVLRGYLVPEGGVALPSRPAIARTILMGDVLSEITQRIARTPNLHIRATRQLSDHRLMPECRKVDRDDRGNHY
ncbi:hypothetical protein ASD85_27235 [Rhizobium sp. Root651]|nr:hypothetical protein ASD85_27235 [Rhizobium sp. Root651]